MKKYWQRIEKAAENLKAVYGDTLSEIVTIYIVTNKVARSGLSGVYTAYIIKDNKPICLVREIRIYGYGADRGFELAYHIFQLAYPDASYLEYLRKENL